MFSNLQGTYFSFEMRFKMSSAIRLNLDQCKILSSGITLVLLLRTWIYFAEDADEDKITRIAV